MPLYTERHKNLRAYRIGRGTISRREKGDDGKKHHRRYTVGDVIMLTLEGAKALHGNLLEEASRSEKPSIGTEVKTVATSVKPKPLAIVPKDWRDMRRADLLALAASIADRPVSKSADAIKIIEEYVGEEE